MASFSLVLPESPLRASRAPSPPAPGSLGQWSPALQTTPLLGRQLELFTLPLREGWGFYSGPVTPPPAPATHPSALPLPCPLFLLQSSRRICPAESSVLSICCLDCSLISCLTCLNLITASQMVVLHFLPPPQSVEPRTAFSPGPLAGDRGKPEGQGTLGRQELSGPGLDRPS